MSGGKIGSSKEKNPVNGKNLEKWSPLPPLGGRSAIVSDPVGVPSPPFGDPSAGTPVASGLTSVSIFFSFRPFF